MKPRYYLAGDPTDPSLDARVGFRRLAAALKKAAKSHSYHSEAVYIVRKGCPVCSCDRSVIAVFPAEERE